jgi:predicted ATP-grasp superfamily ATP-dependent carboligase
MAEPVNLLIFGASARAAAGSALRAGLQPWCADLFGDRDLQTRCPSIRVPAREYPDVFLELIVRELAGPWMYVGGLENHPWLIQAMAGWRRLWGNERPALNRARSPWRVAEVLERANVPFPAVRRKLGRRDGPGQWLVKPLYGAGGVGIHFWTGGRQRSLAYDLYLQQYVEGDARAAIFVNDGRLVRLLGMTRQLVGESWLHAARFRYCGSVGPLPLSLDLERAFLRVGSALAVGCPLRGLFGVDCILRDGVPWPVEVNPRYTASVEVLEYATGVAALDLHRRVFDPTAPAVVRHPPVGQPPYVGKAILFARKSLTFPADGPWLASLAASGPVEELPAFADIPQEGEFIKASHPILTFFARAGSVADCLDTLRQIAGDLDRWLWKP